MRVSLLAAFFALLLPVSAFAGWFVATERETFRPGEPIVVIYEGFHNPNDWMVVVPAGAPDSAWRDYDWIYRDDRPADGSVRFPGLTPGLYEVRGYCCWDGRDFTVQSRAVFEVAAAPSPVDEIQIPREARVNGRYSGLVDVFICREDAATYGRFHDYGRWDGGQWCGADRPAGYWVWVKPNWYIWRNRN